MDSKQVQAIAPARWEARRWWAGIGAAEVMLLLVAAVWGGSYAVAKQATQQLPVMEFIALRFGLTFVVLLPALRPLFNARWRQGLAVGGLLGANLLAIFVCETFGVSLTTASNAAFLISLCVALTPFVEWWLLGQRPAQRIFWAAGLSAVGAAMLSATSPANIAVGWGDALMVLAAFLRAVMVCMTRRLAGHHTMPALTLTAVQSGVMALGAMAISLLASNGAWHMPPATASFWWGMAYLVLLCTVFALFAQNHAASRSSPSRASLLMGSEPVFGALIAVYGFGETVGVWGWAGGLLIVAAAWWVTMPQKLEARPRIP
ncbi:DMT family transporter [Variovorax boronicumulans]|uniref:DMT family transporter n=1 Tax=Variovorax boronicumulans TaxID=436515 RepID=UPI0027875DD5|nr:DMT family transporter [Variovorax boronicumulans]MDQ0042841.1 drug/metabolite transporter (DMT)-like permease [Variovorax boronicumulans]